MNADIERCMNVFRAALEDNELDIEDAARLAIHAALLDSPHDDCAACDEGEPMPHDYRRPLGGARVL